MDPRVRVQRGTQLPSANVARIGANDARHREHLVALARQLTSSASLLVQGSGPIPLLLKWGHVAARRCLGSESKPLIASNIKRPRNVNVPRAAAILYGD